MEEVAHRKSCHTRLIGHLKVLEAHKVTPLDFHTLSFITEQVQQTWNKCEEFQDKLVSACVDDAGIAVQESAFSPVYATYTSARLEISKMQQIIPNPSQPSVPTSTAGGATTAAAAPTLNVRLPQLDLPTFDGDFANWIFFKDLFAATINNNTSLAPAHKLQYLKSALGENPLLLIKSIATTDANYAEAWKILTDRYENEREIVQAILDKILEARKVRSENVHDLKKLLDEFTENLRCLSVLKCPLDKWDDLLVMILLKKLDPQTRRERAITQTGTDKPTLDQLIKFLTSYIRGLIASGADNPGRRKDLKMNQTSMHKQTTCRISKRSGHRNHKCSKLIRLRPEERNAKARELNLCLNCLGANHRVKHCSSQMRCTVCRSSHHTLLHPHEDNPRPSAQRQPAPRAVAPAAHTGNREERIRISHVELRSDVILKTAAAHVLDKYGQRYNARIFIDGGSQGEFITEELVSQLREKGIVSVTGFGEVPVCKSKGIVELTLVSQFDRKKSISIYAHVLPRLPTLFPSAKIIDQHWSHLQGLKLADSHWHIPGRVDIVIGQRYSARVMEEERRQGTKNEPVAYSSIYGWVNGGVADSTSTPAKRPRAFNLSVTTDIDFLRRFWELEELPHQKILTADEKQFEDHFLQHFSRDEQGRFQVAIPFNGKQNQLGFSKDSAFRRWIQVEKRLQRNQHYREQYNAFMEEIPAAETQEVPGKTNYLPHHFVTNEDSSTTKLRVVFDGSARTTSGLSLNDTMLVEATNQEDLFDLLLRFRIIATALKADIAKMFRQFRLYSSDADYHRILWRPSPSEPIKEYRLVTVTYGTACATNLATRCLVQLANENKVQYPEAATAMKKSMFVDDLIGGDSTTEKANHLVKTLNAVAASAGLDLRKWCSNDSRIVMELPESARELNLQSFQYGDDVKTLGIRWCPTTDNFGFSTFTFAVKEVVTMRMLLSNLARVFDALGLIGAVTIRAKLLYQELWKLSLKWDDPIPDHVLQGWKEYEEDLKNVVQLKMPRSVTCDNFIGMELHAFADASEKAYGSVVYLKTITTNGVEISMVTSRTKVAPLKQVSLPRLELEAALLTAKLVTRVITTLELSDIPLFLWSDSTIILKWIATSPRRWTTFVANRVAKIQELTPTESWRHVPGVENPAHLASRGVSVQELLLSEEWFKGPAWLSEPVLPICAVPEKGNVDMEQRKTLQTHVASITTDFVENFSSLP